MVSFVFRVREPDDTSFGEGAADLIPFKPEPERRPAVRVSIVFPELTLFEPRAKNELALFLVVHEDRPHVRAGARHDDVDQLLEKILPRVLVFKERDLSGDLFDGAGDKT